MGWFIPIIVAVGSAITAAGGAYKGMHGVNAMREAARIGRTAQRKMRKHQRRFNAAGEEFAAAVARYDEVRQGAIGNALPPLVRFLENLNKTVQVRALSEISVGPVGKTGFGRFVARYVELGGAVSGGLKALAMGTGAKALTVTAVAQGGAIASTGAAISGLSGAAAQSATLAWLGGGAVAAGGGGVAVGSAVLAGVAIAPAVLVGGFVMAHEGEKSLTRAKKYAAKVKRACAEIDAAIDVAEAAQARIEELELVVVALDARTTEAVRRVTRLGARFDVENDEHVRRFAVAIQLAKALVDVARARVLDPHNELEPRTGRRIAKAWSVLESLEKT
jgi:hypothetical protein